MLSACSIDQSINRIIGVCIYRINLVIGIKYALIGELAIALRGVLTLSRAGGT